MGMKRKGLYTIYGNSAAHAALVAQELAGVHNMRRFTDASGDYWLGRLPTGVYVCGRKDERAGYLGGGWQYDPEWKPTPVQDALLKEKK